TSSPKRRLLRWSLVIVLVLIGLFLGYEFIFLLSPQKADQLQQQLAQLQREEHQHLDSLHQEVLDAFDHQLDLCFWKMHAGKERAKERISSVPEMMRLTGTLTWDQMSGDSTTHAVLDQIIHEEMGEEFPCMGEELERLLTQFEEQLSQNQSKWLSRSESLLMASIGKNRQVRKYGEEQLVALYQSELKNRATIESKTMLGGINLARSTWVICSKKSRKVASRMLAGVATRLRISTSSAVLGASLDGPLPIGDFAGLLLEMGALAWVSWDLIQMQTTFKTQINAALDQSLLDYRAELSKRGQETMQDMLSHTQAENQRILEQLEQKVEAKTRHIPFSIP
ncbi:MAG: hypothetical protein AAF399_14725, partial [Bacteroidota bacterium]